MKLQSPAFTDGQEMDQKYGKKIDNMSVPLSWEDVPAGTKSFALSCVDHHPVAHNFVHWLVSDLGLDVTSLPENAAAGQMPPGSVELKPYYGPAPPSGTHDYTFTLYALGVETLSLRPGVGLEEFTDAAQKNALATAVLTGKFTKQ